MHQTTLSQVGETHKKTVGSTMMVKKSSEVIWQTVDKKINKVGKKVVFKIKSKNSNPKEAQKNANQTRVG